MAYKETHNWFTDLWLYFVSWRERHIKERNFVIILALVVGVICGFAAQLLKYLIHLISGILTSHLSITGANYLFLVYPMVGIILVTLFVRFVVKDNISHGVTRVLYAISRRKSRLKKRNMYSSLIASSVTIGFGGSVGAEGPIVFTGAAIGSNIGQAFRLSPRILMLLVGCGAAAGIAGIFRAPIAGMLFTLEVLMIDLTGTTVMPLLISSITGATVAYVLEGYNAEFFFAQSEPFQVSRIPYAALLGNGEKGHPPFALQPPPPTSTFLPSAASSASTRGQPPLPPRLSTPTRRTVPPASATAPSASLSGRDGG